MSLIIKNKNAIDLLIKDKPHLVEVVFVNEKFMFDTKIFELIKNNKIKVEKLERKVFEKTIGNTSKIAASVKDYSYSQLNDLISKNSESSKILILDRIHDPQNFGAIIRSAHLFGIDGIIILDHNQCAVTETVINTSVGAAFLIDICVVNNISNAINQLKQNGYWIYGSYISDKTIDIKNVDFDRKCAVVIGNEGEGITQKISNYCDVLFKIETKKSSVDSLNASVAAGIIFYSLQNM